MRRVRVQLLNDFTMVFAKYLHRDFRYSSWNLLPCIQLMNDRLYRTIKLAWLWYQIRIEITHK